MKKATFSASLPSKEGEAVELRFVDQGGRMNEWLVSNEGFTPVLEDRALQVLERYGTMEHFNIGDIVVLQGEPYERFIAIVDGTIVVEQQTDAGIWPVRACEKGEFIGEINTLSGSPSRVRARAATAGVLLSLNRRELQLLMEAERALGEIIMGAYIRRHFYIVARGEGDLVLIGSSMEERTIRLREVLSRNSRPHLFLDLEAEPDIEVTLKGLGIAFDDLPVLIHHQVQIMRNPSIEAVASVLGATLH